MWSTLSPLALTHSLCNFLCFSIPGWWHHFYRGGRGMNEWAVVTVGQGGRADWGPREPRGGVGCGHPLLTLFLFLCLSLPPQW